MARLPEPGGDAGEWSKILNEYLSVSHNADGTLKKESVENVGVLSATTDEIANLPTRDAHEKIHLHYLARDAATKQLHWAPSLVVNVKDFGAKGDGVTDDTAAIQAAIDFIPYGGAVTFNRGTYMTTGIKIKTQGTALRGSVRLGTKIKRFGNSTAPLIDASGTGTIDNHRKFFTIDSMTLDGDNKPGALIRAYFADNFLFRNINFRNSNGVGVDFVEVWDTYFVTSSWENCGSTTEPALWMRNTMPAGEFGAGNDNTNQIHFEHCRWEGFKNGAVWLDGAANGSPHLLNGIFFVSCKMESWVVAGPPLRIMPGSTVVFLTQTYIAIMKPNPGFVSPVDAIEDSGSYTLVTGLYVQWGANIIPNSFIHVVKGAHHTYFQLYAYFTAEAPITGTIVVEPAASQVTIASGSTNKPQKLVGDMNTMVIGGPSTGYRLLLNNVGTFRIINWITGNDILKLDNNATRPALQLLGGLDLVGYSDNYATEMWRIVGQNGAARFAKNKFQIDGAKGHVGINSPPVAQIAMLIKPALEGDRGIAVVRPTATATNRLMEFQDETFNIQGLAIDAHGRMVAVGTPPKVTPGAQAAFARPGVQVRDIAGNVAAGARTTAPTAAGPIATITFSRPYTQAPLFIVLSDNSATESNLYISARDVNGFTVSTRTALTPGAILNFDYAVIA